MKPRPGDKVVDVATHAKNANLLDTSASHQAQTRVHGTAAHAQRVRAGIVTRLPGKPLLKNCKAQDKNCVGMALSLLVNPLSFARCSLCGLSTSYADTNSWHEPQYERSEEDNEPKPVEAGENAAHVEPPRAHASSRRSLIAGRARTHTNKGKAADDSEDDERQENEDEKEEKAGGEDKSEEHEGADDDDKTEVGDKTEVDEDMANEDEDAQQMSAEEMGSTLAKVTDALGGM
jgi:type IV secretory pathway VirB10-like protein